jgi:predicted alpha/beta-fold hydrolase
MHKITTTVLYNGRATWDIRQVVKWCRKTFPNRPLFGIGFSLGANMMTNVSIARRHLKIATDNYSMSVKKEVAAS